MGLLIDTHYHMPSGHRANISLRSLLENLSSLRREPSCASYDLAAVLMACDRDDPVAALWECRESLRRDDIMLDHDPVRGVVACTIGGESVTLFPGRQFQSIERVEVLALGKVSALETSAPLADILDTIERAETVPVIPWSPGRWTGKRGRLIRKTLALRAEGSVLLGEIALRPAWAIATSVHRWAAEAGTAFLYGTDPMPARGDESIGGRFATRFPELDANTFTPSAARQEAALGHAHAAGARNSIFDAACRYASHYKHKAFGA